MKKILQKILVFLIIFSLNFSSLAPFGYSLASPSQVLAECHTECESCCEEVCGDVCDTCYGSDPSGEPYPYDCNCRQECHEDCHDCNCQDVCEEEQPPEAPPAVSQPDADSQEPETGNLAVDDTNNEGDQVSGQPAGGEPAPTPSEETPSPPWWAAWVPQSDETGIVVDWGSQDRAVENNQNQANQRVAQVAEDGQQVRENTEAESNSNNFAYNSYQHADEFGNLVYGVPPNFFGNLAHGVGNLAGNVGSAIGGTIANFQDSQQQARIAEKTAEVEREAQEVETENRTKVYEGALSEPNEKKAKVIAEGLGLSPDSSVDKVTDQVKESLKLSGGQMEGSMSDFVLSYACVNETLCMSTQTPEETVEMSKQQVEFLGSIVNFFTGGAIDLGGKWLDHIGKSIDINKAYKESGLIDLNKGENSETELNRLLVGLDPETALAIQAQSLRNQAKRELDNATQLLLDPSVPPEQKEKIEHFINESRQFLAEDQNLALETTSWMAIMLVAPSLTGQLTNTIAKPIASRMIKTTEPLWKPLGSRIGSTIKGLFGKTVKEGAEEGVVAATEPIYVTTAEIRETAEQIIPGNIEISSISVQDLQHPFQREGIRTGAEALAEAYPDRQFKVLSTKGSSAVIFEDTKDPSKVYKVFREGDPFSFAYADQEAANIRELANEVLAPRLHEYRGDGKSPVPILVMDKIPFSEDGLKQLTPRQLQAEIDRAVSILEKVNLGPGDVEFVLDQRTGHVISVDSGGFRPLQDNGLTKFNDTVQERVEHLIVPRERSTATSVTDTDIGLAIAQATEKTPFSKESWQLPFRLINNVLASSNDVTQKGIAIDANTFELLVKQQIIKNTLAKGQKVDSGFVKEVLRLKIFKPRVERVTDGYWFITGKAGTTEGEINKGRYVVSINSLPGVDIKVPTVVDLTKDSSFIVPIEVKEGSGKVERIATNKNWNLRGIVYADEKKEDKNLSKIKIAVFSEDKNESLPWAGLNVKLKELNQDKTVYFNSGWNLITLDSLPIQGLTASSLLQKIAKQGGYATTISRYQDGRWQSYVIRGDKDFSGEDFPIELGKGYFVRAHKDSLLTISAQDLVAPVPLELSSGWNVVGFPYSSKDYQAETVIDTLNAQNGEADAAARWESGLWDTFVKKQQQKYGENFAIENNRGYLLRLQKQTSFKID